MKQFPQLATPGGYRPPDGPNEHSSGHALDVMIPDAATQKQVRDWALQQPNVNYVLNQQKQWNPDGSSSDMPDRGNPTKNHRDHDHINVAGDYQPDPTAVTPPVQPMTVARRRKASDAPRQRLCSDEDHLYCYRRGDLLGFHPNQQLRLLEQSF